MSMLSTRLDEAGRFTSPTANEPNNWIEHLNSDEITVGTYSIPDKGVDDQTPHCEDEVYIVKTGTARLQTPHGTFDATAGDTLYVPANTEHKWIDIRGDLTLIVIVAPRFNSRRQGGSQ